MSPASRAIIHNLQMCGLGHEFAYVPRRRLEPLVILPGNRAHDLTIHNQSNLRLGGISPSDQEANKSASDRERFAHQAALRIVSAEEAVHQAMTQESRNPLLVW